MIDHDKQHLIYRQNFRGCVENIMFNGVNIAELARHRRPNIRFEVQPGGWSLLPALGELLSWVSLAPPWGDRFPGARLPAHGGVTRGRAAAVLSQAVPD